ncbi:MAG: hypothetical protein L0Z70_06085 [Chloroflexi bacterium]|nr:hypothetical protein [Chloroflexota bacterium]
MSINRPAQVAAPVQSADNFSRIGGAAVILAILLSIAYVISPIFLAIGVLALAVFTFALYRIFSADSPALSLGGLVLGAGGAVLLAAFLAFTGSQNNAMQNTAIWAAFFTPPLFFGLLAYQHPRAGMPRALGVIGLAGGVGGLLNMLLTLAGGGDWSNPNNPALSPLIMGMYYLGMLFTLVWMVWTSISLLRRKA